MQPTTAASPFTENFTPALTQDTTSSFVKAKRWTGAWRNPAAWIGALIVMLYLLLGIGGDWIAPYSATEQHLQATLQPPSTTYWFGTDQFGRDILSRVIIGSRSILLLATASTLLSLALGVAAGVSSAYYGGWVDEAVMRVTDVLLAFPALLLALLILSTLGSDMIYLIGSIGIVFAPGIARVIRSVVLELKTREFVDAARIIGASNLRIMLREIVPNTVAVIGVEGAIYFGYAILVGAGLGFLGLGVQPPSPDWGLQVNDGRNFILTAPWVVIFPALAISSLVIGVNLLVDGLGPNLPKTGS